MKKRTLSLLIAVILLLSVIPVVSLPVAAADIEGDWDTFRVRADYVEPEDPNEEHIYTPAGGYEYTDEGFVMIGADYSNTTPFNTVQTKEKQAIKDGVYLEFRIDEYAYGGESGTADHWLCFSIWDSTALSPGGTKAGAGWLCLIRCSGVAGEVVALESWNTVAYEEGVTNGSFTQIGGIAANAPAVDETGREIYTVEITHDGTNYIPSINGTTIPGYEAIAPLLDALDPNGEFHVGVTMMSTVKDGQAAMSILKYGTDKNSATVPVGSDSKQPEDNPNQPPAEIADPSTVPANTPALLYNADSTLTTASGGQMSVSPMGDGSYHVEMVDANGTITFKPRRTVSYAAEDFPVIGILLRNCYANAGTVWFFSGDVTSANHQYTAAWSPLEGDYFGANDEYSFVIIDLTDLWATGRHNGFRLDFNSVAESDRVFDICYAGQFRSAEEAAAYNTAYITEKNLVSNETTPEETTQAPADTSSPTEDTSADTSADTAGGTTPADTSADTAITTEAETKAQSSGCASLLSSASALLTAAAAAFVMRKRR